MFGEEILNKGLPFVGEMYLYCPPVVRIGMAFYEMAFFQVVDYQRNVAPLLSSFSANDF